MYLNQKIIKRKRRSKIFDGLISFVLEIPSKVFKLKIPSFESRELK